MSIAQFLPHLCSAQVVRYHILRSDIEKKNIGPTLQFLKGLIATPDLIRKNNGVLSLSLSGYENHPDRLEAHKEIRRFFVLLDCAFPYWFHVCNRLDKTLRIIFTSLVDIYEVQSTEGGGKRLFECDESSLPIFLHSHTIQALMLHREADISQMDSDRIIRAAYDYFAIAYPSTEGTAD